MNQASTRWYRHRAIVDCDHDGHPFRMTGSVGDIHDRKCAEMQTVEEIRHRDNFLTMLSHELRNPMGAVLNAIELHVINCDGPLHVFADPARIKQAQVNLLANASKYTPVGGDVWFSIERQGNEAAVTVRDSGEGIPGEILESIFDLFVQSETTLARSSGGVGVGLSLARSIVEAHDGTVVAESDGPTILDLLLCQVLVHLAGDPTSAVSAD